MQIPDPDPGSPVWRVTCKSPTTGASYYAEPSEYMLFDFEKIVADGLTLGEALALADLLTVGEQDGS